MNNRWVETTIEVSVREGLIAKPIDGNHGELHPKKKDFVPSGIPFIMASDLQDGQVNMVDCNFITKEQSKKLRKGFAINEDILISHKGTIGRVAILETDLDFIVLTPQVTYYRILKPEILFNRYLYYYFQSPDFSKEMEGFAKAGSTRAYIGITKQLKLPLRYPPFPEQKQIVAILDEAFEAIKQAKANIEKNIQNAQELFQSKLNEFFSQRGAGWEERSLGELCELISGQHIMAKDYNTKREGIGYLTGPSDFGDIHPTVSKWTTFPKRTALPDDILITVKGSGVGKINLLDNDEVAISRQLMAIRAKNIDTLFLYSFLQLQYDYFQYLANGAAIPGISRNDVLDLSINVPDTKTQLRVVTNIGYLKETIGSMLSLYRDKLANLEELKKSLLQKAFSGELTKNFTKEVKDLVTS